MTRHSRLTLTSCLFFIAGFFSFNLVHRSILTFSSSSWRRVFQSEPHGPRLDPETLDQLVESSDRLQGHWNDTMDHTHEGEDIVAQAIASKVRVLCWILTTPDRHDNADQVKLTWAPRCNKFLFVSSVKNDSLPSIAVNGLDEWTITKNAFIHLYQNYRNDFDFFMKADDRSYIIVENLRYLLKDVSPDALVHFGRHLSPHVKQGYVMSAAGYVLTRGALKRVVEQGFNHISPKCPLLAKIPADRHLGDCLESVGVAVGDSRDSSGLERFHPVHLTKLYHHMGNNFFLRHENFYPLQEGTQCCSDFSITFHDIPPDSMYEMHYYVYHLTSHGVIRNFQHYQSLIHQSENNDKHLDQSENNDKHLDQSKVKT